MLWKEAPYRGSCWIAILWMTTFHNALATPDSHLIHLSYSSPDASLIKLPFTSRHEAQERPRRLDVGVTPSFQSAGEHFVHLFVGTPPQLRTMVIDTASYYTSFICSGCLNCGNRPNAPFQQNRSRSFVPRNCTSADNTTIACTYSQTYLDDSNWTGFEAFDQSFISNLFVPSAPSPSLRSFNLDFFCEESVNGNFLATSTDGILGMGFADTSFWYQIYLAGVTQSPTFSVCYVAANDLAYANQFPNGTVPAEGVLTLGGSDTGLHDGNMRFTSNATNANTDFFFHVFIRQVYFGLSPDSAIPLFNTSDINETQQLLNVAPYGTFVDTGTAVSTFPTGWYDVINQAWQSKLGNFFDPFLAVTKDDLDAIIGFLPTFYFQLEGIDPNNAAVSGLSAASFDSQNPFDVIVPFPPSQYMQQLGRGPDTIGTIFYGPQFNFSDADFTILGENFISGHDVYFDYLNDRIGWAKSDCSYDRVQPTPSPTLSRPPTFMPTTIPTQSPTFMPTTIPTQSPTVMPTTNPSSKPTVKPTARQSKKREVHRRPKPQPKKPLKMRKPLKRAP